jgi:predicted nucleotidyltransferase component of viral defense system
VRERRRVVFDRFLARMHEAAPDRWLLKGGFALDLRLAERARATRDVDIEWQASEDELGDTLVEATALTSGDFFRFAIERARIPPERLGGAHRFRVTASLAGRLFETFQLDVGMASVPVDEHDTLTSNLLSFAEVKPVEIPAIPLERQLAEKLHAYTRRYSDERPSSRAKDLIDIVLIRELKPFKLEPLRAEIVRVFEAREAQSPSSLPAPPSEWARPYRVLADEVGIDHDLGAGHRLAATFLDPVLAAEAVLTYWDAEELRWRN